MYNAESKRSVLPEIPFLCCTCHSQFDAYLSRLFSIYKCLYLIILCMGISELKQALLFLISIVIPLYNEQKDTLISKKFSNFHLDISLGPICLFSHVFRASFSNYLLFLAFQRIFYLLFFLLLQVLHPPHREKKKQ